jgi:hypothetical protein
MAATLDVSCASIEHAVNTIIPQAKHLLFIVSPFNCELESGWNYNNSLTVVNKGGSASGRIEIAERVLC